MKTGRPSIERRRAHIKHAMMVTGISGALLHRALLRGGYLVSLSTVYNWIHEVGPGPEPEAVELIAKTVGRTVDTLYRSRRKS